MSPTTIPDTDLIKTKNDLPHKVRHEEMSFLQGHLADALDLKSQAKQAHWNVKGPNFIGLHQLFDKVAAEAEEWSDLLAERIVQFGGLAEGTLRMAAKRTQLAEYPSGITSGKEHVAALSLAIAAFAARARAGIAQCDKRDDAATADILTEIVRGADKLLWFVEAHGQSAT
jgi:starvation-inducible DNA-binding protein